MQRHLLQFDSDFEVVAGNDRAQVGTMVLDKQESVGGKDNRHQNSDQWIYVVDGAGEAFVGDQRFDLRAGVLLLVEAGEAHQISNVGPDPLRMLTIYVPPAY